MRLLNWHIESSFSVYTHIVLFLRKLLIKFKFLKVMLNSNCI